MAKRPRTRVSDHAVLRYLERVQGFDIEALRSAIGRRVEAAAETGATAVVIEGFAYQLRPDDRGVPTVTTVRPHNDPGFCPGAREMRRRGKDWRR